MTDYFKRNIQALDYSKSMVSQMHEIASPLFANTKISNFSYLKFQKDGRVLNLSTEDRWIQYRFDQNIKYKILFKDNLKNTKLNVPYIYLWPAETNDLLLGALHQYDIWNGCNIYIAGENEIEVFSFASERERVNMQNFYVNNLDLLRGFILCFKEKINEFPDQDRKENLIATDLEIPNIATTNTRTQCINEAKIYNNIKPRRIHIRENVYVTWKELECCAFLMRGDNIKTIAQKTKLSPRTVETHINNAKRRTSSHTKACLLDLIGKNQWIFDALAPAGLL